MVVIGLDNGHGLNTPGKRTPEFPDGTKSSYTGKNFMHEWEFNRRVVQLLKPMLERCGFRVFEISPTDEDTSINDRWKRANDLHVNYFLSVHANALDGDYDGNGSDGKDPQGIETLVAKGGSAESFRIGRILQKHLVDATGLADRCKDMPNKLYERDNVGVLVHTNMPAGLIECGFMDNIREAKLLLSEDYRKLIAITACKALCEAFNMEYVPEPQKQPQNGRVLVFSDIPPGHWCEANVKMLKDAGVLKGLPDGTFGGDKPVTRYELAAAMAEMLRKGVK